MSGENEIKSLAHDAVIPGQVMDTELEAPKDLEPALITVEQGSHGNKGTENPAFVKETMTSFTEETQPLLTYKDFMPKFISAATGPDQAPVYSRFSFVIDQANEWLTINQAVTVWKCETIWFRLTDDEHFDVKSVLYSESSYGINRYVMGLRLWLVPRPSDSIPVAQIGYTTAIPGESYRGDDQGTKVLTDTTDTPQNQQGGVLPSLQQLVKAVVSSPSTAVSDTQLDSEEKENNVTKDGEKPQDTGATDNTDSKGDDPPDVSHKPLQPISAGSRKDIAAHLSTPSHKVCATVYSSMTATIKGLNKQLTRKPLPGVILNVENLTLKASTESTSPHIIMDPECTTWVEIGRRNTVYVFAIRIFYLKGREEICTIGYHDELPEMSKMGATIKFGPFSTVVTRMGEWLRNQKNMRVVNMQSVNMQCVLDKYNVYQVNTDRSGFTETAHLSTRYAKVLRLFYVTMRKDDLPPYSCVTLTTRLFVPVRRGEKSFESFPKTMHRMMKWMDYTRLPPFCVETVQYQIVAQGSGKPVFPDRVDSSVNRNSGRHQLTTVRLYLPSEFIEPPPEISPDVATVNQGWGCSIS